MYIATYIAISYLEYCLRVVTLRENHTSLYTRAKCLCMRTKCLYMSDPATSTRGLNWSAQAFHCECKHSHLHKYVTLHLGGTVCRLFHCGIVNSMKQMWKCCNLCHLFHCGMVMEKFLICGRYLHLFYPSIYSPFGSFDSDP